MAGALAGAARKRPVIGVNAGDVLNRPGAGRQLDRLRKLGVQDLRLDADWQAAETQPWVTDPLARKLRKHGLGWYALLGYSTSWDADGTPPFAPPDPAAYARGAAKFAKRYGKTARSIEVWNEPNVNKFFQGASPQQYAALYAAADKAIKQADPRARVVVGGVAHQAGWRGWTQQMIDGLKAAGVTPDAIGYHAYGANPAKQVRLMRQLLDANGLEGTQIDVNEYGVSSHQMHPRQRERYMRRATRSLMRSGVATVMPYVWSGPHFQLAGTPSGRGFESALRRQRFS